MRLLVIIGFLSVAACITVKPKDVAWHIEGNKLCSFSDAKGKKKICQEPKDFKADEWILLNQKALKEKFNTLLNEFNQTASK